MSMNDLIDKIVKAAETDYAEPRYYIENGLLHCSECKTPVQYVVEILGENRKVSCLCKCQEKKRDEETKKWNEEQKAERIRLLRLDGVIDRSLSKCRFEKAQMTEILKKCKAYADNWPEMRKNNSGLLLWGGVGNGKTYAAACIVNSLIDQSVPAMITSFPRILSSGGYDKSEIARKMRRYDLVVIDDLGVERESDYALETVFMVIDERYKSGKPLIVTTNLTMDEMKNAKNIRFSRIYDRILEMCVPIYFSSPSRRTETAQKKKSMVSEVLIGGDQSD